MSDSGPPLSSSSSFLPSSQLLDDVELPEPPPRRIVIQNVPSSFLVLPPVAALIGAVIGIQRGGSRARLRFLAENAHRQPRTVQGWYFYQKTRNYRVILAACRTGGKYGLALGGATALYVLVDECVGLAREEYFGVKKEDEEEVRIEDEYRDEIGLRRKKVTWRNGGVAWQDGVITGGLLGACVGTAYRLPRSLFVRTLIIGTTLGGLTSAMQVAQAKIGRLEEEEIRKAKAEEARIAEKRSLGADEAVSDNKDGKRKSWASLRAWIPGPRKEEG